MICPDIWTLPPPSTLITHKRERLDDKALHQLRQTINAHYFNSLLSVVVPDAAVVPSQLEAVLDDTDHYVVEQVAVGEFVQRRFIEAFVKRGHFYGISDGQRIDLDDCAAVSPSDDARRPPTLHLSLNRAVYQSLGLEGTVSHFTQKSRERYNIRLNLLDPNLSPDTKYYARVHSGLSNDALPRMDMRIVWQPPADSRACSSSVAKYFEEAGYRVRLVKTERRHHQESGLRVPLLGRDDDVSSSAAASVPEFFASAADVVEYIGMLSLNCELEADEYLSGYRCLGRSAEVGYATVAQWRGLFTIDTVWRLLEEMRKYIAEQPQLPWVSLYCSGFANSPVSFGHKEHTVGMAGGDNSFVIVLGADGLYQLTTVLSSNKLMK